MKRSTCGWLDPENSPSDGNMGLAKLTDIEAHFKQWLSGWDKPREEVTQDFMQLQLNLEYIKKMQKEITKNE